VSCSSFGLEPQDFGDLEAMARWMGVAVHVSIDPSVNMDWSDYATLPRHFVVGDGTVAVHVWFSWIAGCDGRVRCYMQSTLLALF
jgi:hypothetical protein